IASAFYVDFDSPVMRNLPDIVREQRTSVEDSFEFAVAHMCAHQWWGMSVGSAPERTPVQDEALAHWSALVYYREAHSPERAAQSSPKRRLTNGAPSRAPLIAGSPKSTVMKTSPRPTRNSPPRSASRPNNPVAKIATPSHAWAVSSGGR